MASQASWLHSHSPATAAGCGCGYGYGRGRVRDFAPFGVEVERKGFGTPWDVTGQKFQGLGLKIKVFIVTFQDLERHLCQKIMRVAA